MLKKLLSVQTLAAARSMIATLGIAVLGLVLILVSETFQWTVLKVSIDSLTANVGALFLIIGVFQWLFENFVRNEFTADLRDRIIGYKRVSDSGISDFFIDSKDVDFSSEFLTSKNVTIGVIYSAKLIDNATALLKERCARGLSTTIVHIDADSETRKYVVYIFSKPGVDSNISKIADICVNCDPDRKFITIKAVDSLLRYSFIRFDSQIWVIVGTSGKGRRAVPGFFVRDGKPWFDHFHDDISRVLEIAK